MRGTRHARGERRTRTWPTRTPQRPPAGAGGLCNGGPSRSSRAAAAGGAVSPCGADYSSRHAMRRNGACAHRRPRRRGRRDGSPRPAGLRGGTAAPAWRCSRRSASLSVVALPVIFRSSLRAGGEAGRPRPEAPVAIATVSPVNIPGAPGSGRSWPPMWRLSLPLPVGGRSGCGPRGLVVKR